MDAIRTGKDKDTAQLEDLEARLKRINLLLGRYYMTSAIRESRRTGIANFTAL